MHNLPVMNVLIVLQAIYLRTISTTKSLVSAFGILHLYAALMGEIRARIGYAGPLRSFVCCGGFRQGADLLVVCVGHKLHGEYI